MVVNNKYSNVTWSHSRLNTLMTNPLEYYIIYNLGIKPKMPKTALLIGSAVHELLELNTCDATDYFVKNGTEAMKDGSSLEQCYAENMAKAYFRYKNYIYKELLRDLETNEKLDVICEEHELSITATIPSKMFDFDHKFLGIIDLLILTNKGWILVDYKTSSRTPDWDEYKSQLLKYQLLLKSEFPDTPIYKIAIINLKKTQIKKSTKDTDESFKNRIANEYETKELIDFHIYNYDEFDEAKYNQFYNHMVSMLDTAELMIENKAFYLNYSNIVTEYGPSQFADIFYGTDGCEALYSIRDSIYDEKDGCLVSIRDCKSIDLKAVEHTNVMNNYNRFKYFCDNLTDKDKSKDEIFDMIKEKYITDDDLLEKYYITYVYNKLKENEK